MNKQTVTNTAPPAKAPRDLRLDFFRGMAMFIILLAHTPGNTWTLWIPARFGFSDATEIFVFCSGMASALAFGAVYLKKSWFLGTARIVFRVWQVYWAHIGVILATALLMVMLDRSGLGEAGKTYTEWPPISPLFSHTADALAGFFTLTYIPGLFDILPMYLVILALVPVVMLVHKLGGRYAVFTFVLLVWTCAQLSGWARFVSRMEEDPTELQLFFAMLGEPLTFLNLPGNPWHDTAQWFFNPFGWQLVFFTGFAFGTGWLPAPPVKKWLLWVSAIYLVAMLPFAWHQLHGGRWLPDAWALHDWLFYAREDMTPFRWKTGVGLFRYLHFLAIAYIAWCFVGPGGVKLREGFTAPQGPKQSWPKLALISAAIFVLTLPVAWFGIADEDYAKPFAALSLMALGFGLLAFAPQKPFLIMLGVIAVVTIPYAYVEEIKWASPALDAWIFETFSVWAPETLGVSLILPEERIGIAMTAHLVAILILAWNAIGAAWRQWIVGEGFLSVVPVIRKVGTQSLAVFMVSIVLSRFNGWWMDVLERDVWTRALVNFTGFGVLIATAYLVSWFKKQPWRDSSRGRSDKNIDLRPAGASVADVTKGGGAHAQYETAVSGVRA